MARRQNDVNNLPKTTYSRKVNEAGEGVIDTADAIPKANTKPFLTYPEGIVDLSTAPPNIINAVWVPREVKLRILELLKLKEIKT